MKIIRKFIPIIILGLVLSIGLRMYLSQLEQSTDEVKPNDHHITITEVKNMQKSNN